MSRTPQQTRRLAVIALSAALLALLTPGATASAATTASTATAATTATTTAASTTKTPFIGPVSHHLGPWASVSRADRLATPKKARATDDAPDAPLPVEDQPKALQPRKPAPHTPKDPTSWAKGQEAWLDVPAAGIHLRVFRGGQAMLDRGVVTHYVGSGLPAPVEAGGPGVYWLAGHHTTHGAPLAKATDISVGDIVSVQTRQGTARYRITDLMRTGTFISYGEYYGAHPERGRLLLQTCLSESRRLLVVGELL